MGSTTYFSHGLGQDCSTCNKLLTLEIPQSCTKLSDVEPINLLLPGDAIWHYRTSITLVWVKLTWCKTPPNITWTNVHLSSIRSLKLIIPVTKFWLRFIKLSFKKMYLISQLRNIGHFVQASVFFLTNYWHTSVLTITRPILGLHPANERRCYKVTTSIIGWA